MAQNKKSKNRLKLMLIDMILSLGSVVLSYYLIGIVGEEIDYGIINMAGVYLPVCVWLAMICFKGYNITLKRASVYDFICYFKAMILAAGLYIVVDLVMGYDKAVLFKLFAVVFAFTMMMLERVVYYLLYKKFAAIKRIEKKETIAEQDIDYDKLIENASHKSVRLDVDATRYFVGKTVLITGAGGTIGSGLFRKIVKLGAETVVGLDIYENSLYELSQSINSKDTSCKNMCFEIASIRDYKRMDEVFTKYRPDIVYHAAAHKHVSIMENNPEEAVKNNVFGTFTCAKLSNIYNVEKFIYISTDKANNPCGVMGATKRIGEMIMNYMANKSRVTNYITLRFCNIIGSNASVIPIMSRQIREGSSVYVTDKRASRYFVSAKEAINYIVNMTIKVLPSDIFILNVEQPTNIKQLAHDLIKAYGYKPNQDINVVFGSLRPGERLTEELVPEGASVYEENIYKLEHDKMNGKAFYRKINLLNAATKENDRDNIKKIMMEIIPEYDYKTGDNGNTKSEYALKAEA